jgi:DNA polymerase-3 subunit delta
MSGARDPLQPVYLIWGEDRATIDRAIARLIARVDGEGGMPPERFDAEQSPSEEVAGAAQAMSFGGTRLVIVDAVDRWRAADAAALVDYLSAPNSTTCLALIAGSKPARKLMDAVAAVGSVLQFGPDPGTKGQARRAWMLEHFAKEASRMQLDVPSRVVEHVVDRIVVDRADAHRSGVNAMELTRAAEKLALYADGEPVTVEMVDEMVPAHPDARTYELADAVTAGDARRAFALLHDMAGGDDPQPPIVIQRGLSRHVRALAAVAELGPGLSREQIEAASGLRGYPARKVGEQIRRLSEGAAELALIRVADLELELRDSAYRDLGASPDDGQRFVLEIAVRDLLRIMRGEQVAAMAPG